MDFKLILVLLFYSLSVYFLHIFISLNSYFEYLLYFLEAGDTKNEYDYIIVGCGTAGSLIAHRLSAHKDVSFLVLEAGGNGGSFLDIPAVGPFLQGTIHDWRYKTVPQEHSCHAMNKKQCMWPMGKIIGGSARLNNMVHIRSYLDEIAMWFNNKISIPELQNHLRELEEFDLPYEKLSFKTVLSNSVLKAAGELGFDVNKFGDNSTSGFMDTLVNQKGGARWSTFHNLRSGYFTNKRNTIITNALVEKIIIDPDVHSAQGVAYERYGRKITVTAKKGVIVSSGAIGTPKLLLLSGIGPKKHLNDIGIPVIQDLPVGEGLIDHASTGLDLVLLNKSVNFGISNILSPANVWNYFINGNGLWTASGCEIVAILDSNIKKFDQSSANKTDSNLPDLQLMVLPIGVSTDHGKHLRFSMGFTDSVWESYFSKITPNNSVSFLPIVLHPKSKGTVRLNSVKSSDHPLIDPKYFSHDEDMEVMLRGIDLIKELLNTNAMVNLGAVLNTILFPGCENIPFDTRDYWKCYIRHLTLTTYHPAGTCRMGSLDNVETVVDYDFQVKGIKRLFVADASLFPSLPSGNINTAVALIARIFTDKLIQHE